ncbi:CDGSH iron-sulfur domain-containing protein [Streptomyces sp. NBC_01754]|uniref:CDGSH iron-sulfur domain-containing protein n=1 Tax=Streptomyces sp. NBC_01754 TaxID=2975930 RepID=UPI002DDC83DC|nr:CDGSH iron-sulfur domain-containing protein [Streptomyces sp. NBC_01754]WSC96472.1 CDGSH iron-sulfur domain-containing protein [Streptomyces sp. NBC_01754]
MPSTPEHPRRIQLADEGPLLVEGPVEVVCADGRVAVSDRFVVALCTCRRSRIHPWCDTSHRHRAHREESGDAEPSRTAGRPDELTPPGRTGAREPRSGHGEGGRRGGGL